VTVFATGSELVEPTERPSLSQIRNSNGWQLLAQLRGMGVSARYGGLLRDELAVVREATERAASESDLVLLSGGASTGDLDFVPSALRELGVVLAFESIAMQPGRPTLFGVRDATYFCALPGNPVSTFVVFELMLKPFLFRLMGHEYEPPMTEARLMKPLRRKNTKRRASVPVRLVAPGQVEPVDYHGSAHISALTRAAGLVVLPVGHVGYEEGATVHVRPFSP
jgi:molybdopterin molybdotransferase